LFHGAAALAGVPAALNKVVLEVIVTLGASDATLSETALAWLDREVDMLR
jgi:hypothetical protein